MSKELTVSLLLTTGIIALILVMIFYERPKVQADQLVRQTSGMDWDGNVDPPAGTEKNKIDEWDASDGFDDFGTTVTEAKKPPEPVAPPVSEKKTGGFDEPWKEAKTPIEPKFEEGGLDFSNVAKLKKEDPSPRVPENKPEIVKPAPVEIEKPVDAEKKSADDWKVLTGEARPVKTPVDTPEAAPRVPEVGERRVTGSGYGSPQTYIVQENDNLWNLSRKFYGVASLKGAKRIADANGFSVDDIIRPGQKLEIPPKNE